MIKTTAILFKKETEYALRGLVYIQTQNTKGRRPGIAEIADEIDAPHFYTAKIFQRLAKQGFVSSVKGKGGGFNLTDEQAVHSLKTIISAIEGDHIFCDCGIGLKECSDSNPCPIHERYAPIRDSIDKLLHEENINGLATKTTNDGKPVFTRLK